MINSKHVFWILLGLCILSFVWRVYAEIQPKTHIWYDMRGRNIKEWKLEEHLPKEVQIKPQIKPIEQRKVEKGIQVPPTPKETPREFDLVKFSKAVAKHETASCTKGYGKEYNNCIGLKNGRIAPCKKIGKNRMCIYDTPEESLEAFRKIWKEGYGNKFPTLRMAQVYSGSDRSTIWLENVTKFYNEQF